MEEEARGWWIRPSVAASSGPVLDFFLTFFSPWTWWVLAAAVRIRVTVCSTDSCDFFKGTRSRSAVILGVDLTVLKPWFRFRS